MNQTYVHPKCFGAVNIAFVQFRSFYNFVHCASSLRSRKLVVATLIASWLRPYQRKRYGAFKSSCLHYVRTYIYITYLINTKITSKVHSISRCCSCENVSSTRSTSCVGRATTLGRQTILSGSNRNPKCSL